MSIANYAELLDAARDWIARTDISDAVADDCLKLFETFASRFLRDSRMEQTERLVVDVGEQETELPSLFLEGIALRHTTTPYEQLVYEPAWALGSSDPRHGAGRPRSYTVIGQRIMVWPVTDATYELDLTYYGGLCGLKPAPTSRTRNWLLDRHPDVYLHGLCTELSSYVKALDDAQRFGALRDAGLAAIQDNAMRVRWGAGPLVMRAG